MNPTIYLLCGLPGSGKTTYAKTLEAKGVVRFTLDEQLFKRFGRDFDPELYLEYEYETKEQLTAELGPILLRGESVVLDFGFWKKEERDKYKTLAKELNADWQLCYFDVAIAEMSKRIDVRNSNNADDSQYLSQEMLESFVGQFEVPSGEGETIL